MACRHELERLATCEPRSTHHFGIGGLTKTLGERQSLVILVSRGLDPPGPPLPRSRFRHQRDGLTQRLIRAHELDPVLVPGVRPRVTEHREVHDLSGVPPRRNRAGPMMWI